MSKRRLLYSDCLKIYRVEGSFIESLHEIGLIKLVDLGEDRFVEYSDLSELEQFIRWYKEMDINAEGIEALQHMLKRVRAMQKEIDQLREELHFYKSYLL